MPSVNPFIDTGVNAQGWDGAPVIQQSALPGAIGAPTSPGAQGVGVVGSQVVKNISAVLTGNGMGTANTTNAAGTSENVAMHVAVLVAVALVVVYVFRQSGFRFVAAGSIG